MNSMRLRPPRPPGERASRESQTTEMLCTAEKVSVFGAKPVCSASRAARPQLWLPLEGKLRPQAVMRCRFRLRNRFQTKKVTICFITRWRATPHPAAFAATFPSRGRLSRVVPRGSPSNQVLPRIPKLSPLCTKSLSAVAPGLPVLRGVSGDGAALSPGF